MNYLRTFRKWMKQLYNWFMALLCVCVRCADGHYTLKYYIPNWCKIHINIFHPFNKEKAKSTHFPGSLSLSFFKHNPLKNELKSKKSINSEVFFQSALEFFHILFSGNFHRWAQIFAHIHTLSNASLHSTKLKPQHFLARMKLDIEHLIVNFVVLRSPYSTFVSMFVMVLMQSNSRFEENFKKIPISLCNSSVIDSKSSLCYTYLNSFWSNKAKPHVRQISINKTSSSFLACVYAICMCVNMWRFSVDEMWLLKSR